MWHPQALSKGCVLCVVLEKTLILRKRLDHEDELVFRAVTSLEGELLEALIHKWDNHIISHPNWGILTLYFEEISNLQKSYKYGTKNSFLLLETI